MFATRNDYDGTSTSFNSYNVIVSNEPNTDLGLFPGVALSSQRKEPHDGQYITVVLASNRLLNWPCNLLPEMATLLPVFHRSTQPQSSSLLHHSTRHRDPTLPDRIAYALSTTHMHQDAEGSLELLFACLAYLHGRMTGA